MQRSPAFRSVPEPPGEGFGPKGRSTQRSGTEPTGDKAGSQGRSETTALTLGAAPIRMTCEELEDA
ncbi:hypothetical protein GCM10009678_79990 [Actinomadura kijaniata]